MLHVDREIRSISELLTFLKTDLPTDQPTWFRGQANAAWQLQPSLARRADALKKEKMLIKRFVQTASPYLTDNFPKTTWDWIFLMQHHRVPTRLLDWTESPLVGLYFAVSGEPTDAASLWCLDPLKLNKEARLKFSFDLELPAFGSDDKFLDNYLPDQLEAGVSELFPIAAIGQRNSRRMIAQAGTFTINHLKHNPIEEIGEQKHIWRYIVPPDAKQEILTELEYLGYSEMRMFPEVDSAGKHVAREVLR